MRKTFMLPLNLQLFADEMGAAETGVESAPAAEVQSEGSEGSATQTGVEGQAAAEPEKQNNFEKAFAKRLADAQAKWEAEAAEKYKGHEDYKFLADYLQQANNMDVMSLKERIELDRLQERAEQANVPPDVLKRIDELEAKAAKADEFEQQQAQTKQLQEFENGLKEFASDKQIDGKPVDHMELWAYMHENGIAKPEAAFKAMKADILEQKLETAKKDAISEYLDSKKAPKAEGSGTPGMTTFKPTGNLDAASDRALARFRAARQSS